MSEEVSFAESRLKSILKDEENDINDDFAKALDDLLKIDEDDARESALLLLDDNYDLQDLMWSILHKAEEFDDPKFVRAYFKILPQLEKKSPDWSRRIMGRCLNSVDCLATMRSSAGKLLPEQVDAIRKICEFLASEKPSQFEERSRQLIAAL